MSAKHTPGPWVVVVSSRGTAMAIAATAVAKIPGETNPVRYNGIGMPNSAKGHANARLIAAAPELLEALTALVTFNDAPLNDRRPEGYGALLASARAAIKKATSA